MGFGLNWRTIAKHFEDQYQILTYDQRGHGRSFHPVGGYEPETYAEDLKLILDELGWNAITLVGHSMGGRNALEFAHRFPNDVRRLVIEDIGPQMQASTVNSLEKLLDEVPTPFASKREAKAFFEGPFLARDTSQARVGLAQFLYANLTENEQKQAVWRFYEPGIRASIAIGRAKDRWAQIEALQMPTLLLRGELSTDLSRPIFEEILHRNPKIEGVEIKGVGHWIHSEKPAEFIQALESFFLRHPTPA